MAQNRTVNGHIQRDRQSIRTQGRVFRETQADLGRQRGGLAEHAQVAYGERQCHRFFHFENDGFILFFDIGRLDQSDAA